MASQSHFSTDIILAFSFLPFVNRPSLLVLIDSMLSTLRYPFVTKSLEILFLHFSLWNNTTRVTRKL